MKTMHAENKVDNGSRNSVEESFSASFAKFVEAIVLLDLSGKIRFWNDGAELLFHQASEEVIGEYFYKLISSTKAGKVEIEWVLNEIKDHRFLRGYETTCIDFNGDPLLIELTANELVDQNGDLIGIALILRDITLIKQRETRMNQRFELLNTQVAERTGELTAKLEELSQVNEELQKLDQTRSEFVSVVSHQIRAPLTNMGGAVQRMQADCNSKTPTCIRMMTIIDEQVNRLDRLVQDVLTATTLEEDSLSFQLEPVGVISAVKHAVDQFRAGNGARSLQAPDKPGLPMVYADRDRIIEIIINLIDNADKYSVPGQPIVIDVRADQTEVTLAVKDSGPGFLTDNLDLIFEKFYRSDSSDAQTAYGYGLGLYVCKKLVEAQGGRIWAENNRKGGAVVSFTIPVWQG